MPKFLAILQIIIAVLLIGTILLQQRGGGLSTVFGGSGTMYRTRRGVEKGVFVASIILSGLFLLTAFLAILLAT